MTTDTPIDRERLLALLREIEQHCPCGARPESLSTHPHVGGCPVDKAIELLAAPLRAAEQAVAPGRWCFDTENMQHGLVGVMRLFDDEHQCDGNCDTTEDGECIAEYREVDIEEFVRLLHSAPVAEQAGEHKDMLERDRMWCAALIPEDVAVIHRVTSRFNEIRTDAAVPARAAEQTVDVEAMRDALEHATHLRDYVLDTIVPELRELRPGGSMQTGLEAMARAIVYEPSTDRPAPALSVDAKCAICAVVDRVLGGSDFSAHDAAQSVVDHLNAVLPGHVFRLILDRSNSFTRWAVTTEADDRREHYVPKDTGRCIHCGKTAAVLGVPERDDD